MHEYSSLFDKKDYMFGLSVGYARSLTVAHNQGRMWYSGSALDGRSTG